MNERICDQCGHEFAPHLIMMPDAEKCGVIICQNEDCDCFATWAIESVSSDAAKDIAQIYGITDAASAREAMKNHGKPDLDAEYLHRLLED